ncbi:MAG TPA: DUF3180 domain-containing protein [Streptosporangiaceae bacterium]|nr:DUF3180 domain-containing protein [Streptosporangiaceae bacterium]
MKPTKIGPILFVAALCAAVCWLVLRLVYRVLPPLPWSGVPTMVIVALVEAYSGMLLRARIHQRPGAKPVEGIAVARVAALAKASVYAAAVIGGVAAGFSLYVAGSLDKAFPRHDAFVALGTLAAAVVLAAAALYLEYCCRVPKQPDEENGTSPAWQRER